MSKKLSISFAPLLAIVAFAVMPVAAQALPHWNSEKVKLTAGVKIPVISWGGTTNLSQTSAIGEINCKGVGSGYVENPETPVEGAGVGKSQESTFWECKSAGCEKAAGETGLPLTSYATTDAGHFSWEASSGTSANPEGWSNLLEDAGAPPIEEKIGEPFTSLTEYPKEKAGEPSNGIGGPAKAGEIMALVTCETPPGFAPHVVGVSATFQGELHPTIKNGATQCDKASEVEFKAAASGALHSAVGGEGTNSGRIKFCGYTSQNLITATDP